MCGNISEWCWDLDHTVSSSSGVFTGIGEYRVIRGGNWRDSAEGCYVSWRGCMCSYRRNNHIVGDKMGFYGFRLVCSVK